MKTINKNVPTVKVILDTRVERENNLYPIKIRVIYNRIAKYYPINIKLSEEDFKKAYYTDKVPRAFKDINLKIQGSHNKAIDAIEQLSVFTFEGFEKEFYTFGAIRNGVLHYYRKVIDSLNSEGKLGTAENYRYSLRSIENFCKSTKKRY